MEENESESGQIALLVLLVVVLVVTVALSLIGRTTENVAISTQLEDSAKALSIAERGLNLAMQAGTEIAKTEVAPGESFTVEKSAIDTAAPYQLKERTPQGQLAIVWLSPHDDSTGQIVEDKTKDYGGASIDVCWSRDNDPGIVVSLLYKSGGNYLVGKGAYSPLSGGRSEDNFNHNVGSGINCGVSGVYGKRISFSELTEPDFNSATDVLLALRIRPVYSDAQFYMNGVGAIINQQGNVFTATGQVNTTTRKVQVDQVYSAPSSLFDYVIYSQQGDFAQ